jgi:hypothetical protein
VLKRIFYLSESKLKTGNGEHDFTSSDDKVLRNKPQHVDVVFRRDLVSKKFLKSIQLVVGAIKIFKSYLFISSTLVNCHGVNSTSSDLEIAIVNIIQANFVPGNVCT